MRRLRIEIFSIWGDKSEAAGVRNHEFTRGNKTRTETRPDGYRRRSVVTIYEHMPYSDYVNESTRSPKQELEDLCSANNFTAAELAMNRVGRISSSQISKLVHQIIRPMVKSFLVLAGWLLLIMALTRIISAGLQVDGHHTLTGMVFLRRFWLFRGLYVLTFVRLGALVMVIASAGAFLMAVLTNMVKAISLIRDLWEAKAAMIEGRVYASEEEKRGSPWDAMREQWTRVRQERAKIFRYAIRDVAVEVSFAGFRALASGAHFNLYYTPRSKLLLSVGPRSGPG